ncbi:MAG TPA: D-alanine--D-serine ligase VanG [Candidatus Aphodomonas merdavium]|nr:D-alanine--D-serine ligase VanG [Candidatus Aphodomonas merdavium]
MHEKKRIAVLFGGCSPEYGVSLQSAASVLQQLDRQKFAVVSIGITRQGDWYLYGGPIHAIQNDTWMDIASCARVLFSPSRNAPAMFLRTENGLQSLPVDAVFPVLHGANGEDGTVQGMFELAGIPIVGCGMLSSALCMHKFLAHRVVEAEGIRAPHACVYGPSSSRQSILAEADALGYPLFVKPVKAGSSFGITHVARAEELMPAVEHAFSFDDKVIVEEAIAGFEVGCAVLESGALTLGEIDEIELKGGFFDFAEKYTLKTSAIHVPARIPSGDILRIKATAARIYRALDCRGFARVDMFYTPKGEIVFNEVNTIPGFTEHSRYPCMMKAAGWRMREVLTAAIEFALHTDRKGGQA